MLIREGRQQGSEKWHQKWGERRESEERGKGRNERGGARWSGGSVPRWFGRVVERNAV